MKNIRYIALGDSYTICEGATTEETWPVLLTKHLQAHNIDITLVANPAVTGWTTRQLIDNELPLFDQSQANFATLLIGVNDWVQKVNAPAFENNFNQILDHLQQRLPNPQNILLITIPDFSATPKGPDYSYGRNISEGIQTFNQIIKKIASQRNLPVVDIFPLTQQMQGRADLVSSDGLHPSAKEYALWEELIFKAVYTMLSHSSND